MSDQIQTEAGPLGASQTDFPTDTVSGARVMDTQGTMRAKFSGRATEIRQRGQNLMGRGMDVVRNEPWRAVLIGMFLGFLLGRRTRSGAHVVRVDYLVPMYHRGQGVMFAGSLALSSMLRLLWRSLAYRGREAMFAARCYSRPLTKATRKATKRAQRKLHIGGSSPYAF